MLNAIVQGLVTGIAVGMVLFFWQRRLTKRDRCLSNALAARQMYVETMSKSREDAHQHMAICLRKGTFG